MCSQFVWFKSHFAIKNKLNQSVAVPAVWAFHKGKSSRRSDGPPGFLFLQSVAHYLISGLLNMSIVIVRVIIQDKICKHKTFCFICGVWFSKAKPWSKEILQNIINDIKGTVRKTLR